MVKVKGIIVYNFVSDEKKSEITERPTDQALISDSVTKTNDKAFKIDPNSINGGVVNGKAISLPVPVYPAAAQAVKAGGAVNVRVKIDTQGKCRSGRSRFGTSAFAIGGDRSGAGV